MEGLAVMPGPFSWASSNRQCGSNTPMDTTQDTARRLTDLEIKASFTEDTLDRLNEVVVRQQRQLERLQRELADLLQQRQAADAPPTRSLRDELPPHY